MTRMLAFVAALFLTAVTVSSSCLAAGIQPLGFTIEPAGNTDRIQVRFKRADREGTDNWSSSFRPAELAGLDPAALHGSGTSPVRFTIARDAGRVDCAGTGGNSMARGSCTLTADRGFNDFLAANGIARPSEEQTFGLIAVNARRELVGALRAANYPAPSISDLTALAAIDVTPDYIRDLAARGYRPRSTDELIQFGALKITPEYIGGFARAGYSDLSASDLVQLKALGVTAEFIAGFERIGYGRLPVSTLVQLKALNVTPEFVRAVQKGDALPSPDRLVMLRALGKEFRNR